MDQIKIGKFIAACRKEQGMTQAKLAENLGIVIVQYQNGKPENPCQIPKLC